MTHPKVFPSLADDYYPAPEHFLPHQGENIFYLLAYADNDLHGLVMTHPINGVLWEAHLALWPSAWGAIARSIVKSYFEWLWRNTTAETCLGMIADDNRLARAFAQRAGMKLAGKLPRALRRNGELHDFSIFYIHRT